MILKLQGWCRRHGVPYIHGCLWDRTCREYGAPPRIHLFIGSRMIVFELPLPYRGLDLEDQGVVRRWQWNRPTVWTHRRTGGL